jgi:hypothetical protein
VERAALDRNRRGVSDGASSVRRRGGMADASAFSGPNPTRAPVIEGLAGVNFRTRQPPTTPTARESKSQGIDDRAKRFLGEICSEVAVNGLT